MISRANGTAQAAQGSVGLLLLDATLAPVYASPEAIHILFYEVSDVAAYEKSTLLADRVKTLLAQNDGLPREGAAIAFLSGRRRYLCRGLPLTPFGRTSHERIGLLIEREAGHGCGRSRIPELYGFAPREREAVELLAEGLKSREIGARLGISHNSVKTILGVVMAKMGVTTRSGILGKLLEDGMRIGHAA